jgi:S-adenosylmethionine hydrolase
MPILTFTSDFGSSDHLVGLVKGEFAKFNEGLNIIDITHNIVPYNYMQAAYVCKGLPLSFPAETIHMILVNSFDENMDHLLLAKHADQFYAVPDNGILTMILNGNPDEVVALPFPVNMRKTIRNFSAIFVEAFSSLLSGVALRKIGTPISSIKERNMMRPLYTDQYIEGQILMIDRFLNVIVNITEKEFEEHRMGRKFKIVLLRDAFIEKISNHYGDVPEGEKLAFFNEVGFLEIAVNKGYAAPLFGLGEFGTGDSRQHERRQYYQTVKVFFE